MWPCLCGPFVAPDGYEFISPVFLVTTSMKFEEDVQLSLRHFASPVTKEEYDVFLSASPTPSITNMRPEYLFQVFEKGHVELTSSNTLCLRHFCLISLGRRLWQLLSEPIPYSVQLYYTGTERTRDALLGFSLCGDTYLTVRNLAF